jgi:hypothetical protein
MMQVINNEKVNSLALTSMVKAGLVSNNPELCGTYRDWTKQGWNFYFERRDGKLYSIMDAEFPHGKEHKEVKTDKFITDTVLKIMRAEYAKAVNNEEVGQEVGRGVQVGGY